MAEHVLREFHIRGATYYDGQSHQLTNCDCVLTNERLIIKDIRGRSQQILLRDITTIEPHLFSLTKRLVLRMGRFAAIHIYGKKAELQEITDGVNAAIASSTLPPSG
jgi:hypothetical protein